MSPTRNLVGNQTETSLRIMVALDLCWQKRDKGNQTETSLEIMAELDPVEERQRGTQRETKGDSLEIMMGLDPVGGRQRETNGEKPRNHDGTGSSRRESKGRQASKSWRNWIPLKGRQRVEITELDPVEGRQRETQRETKGNSLEIMMELDPVGGRQRETKGEKPPNHDGTNSFSLNELRTEAVWGKSMYIYIYVYIYVPGPRSRSPPPPPMVWSQQQQQ